jgi:hypothetical protein
MLIGNIFYIKGTVFDDFRPPFVQKSNPQRHCHELFSNSGGIGRFFFKYNNHSVQCMKSKVVD